MALTEPQTVALLAAELGTLQHSEHGLITATGRTLHRNTRDSLIARGLLSHGTLDEGFPLVITDAGREELRSAGVSVTRVERTVEPVAEAAPARDRIYAMSFPVLNGGAITQGHADYCAAHGHATHTEDGVVAPWCPRCGENVERGTDVLASNDEVAQFGEAERLRVPSVAEVKQVQPEPTLEAQLRTLAQRLVTYRELPQGLNDRLAGLLTDGADALAVPRDEHRLRIYVSDHERGWYSWSCSCNLEGERDLLHREYARDAWREAHGLAPLVNRPLV